MPVDITIDPQNSMYINVSVEYSDGRIPHATNIATAISRTEGN